MTSRGKPRAYLLAHGDSFELEFDERHCAVVDLLRDATTAAVRIADRLSAEPDEKFLAGFSMARKSSKIRRSYAKFP